MSEADRDEVTVSDEQVTVRKSLDTEQFETLAVVFDVHSDRSEPTRIQVADTIPEDIPLDDVGFHPNYGAEHWAIEDRTVVFEREFNPGEEFTTIYGVRDVDDPGESFLDQPTIELLNGQDIESTGVPEANIDALGDIVSEEHSQIVRDVISGEADTMPGLEATEAPATEPAEASADAEPVAADTDPLPDDEVGEEPAGEPAEPPIEAADDEPEDEPDVEAEPAVSDAEAEPMDADADTEADQPAEAPPAADDAAEPPEPDVAADPAEPDEDEIDVEAAVQEEFAEGEASSDEPVDEDADEITVPVTGGVARVLAKELRQGSIAPEDRRLLREELSTGEGSTEARIRHLQNEVSDLAAYTDALEAFLDEEGAAEELIEDFQDDLDALSDQVDAELATFRDDISEDLESLRTDLTGLREDVAAFDDRLEETTSDVDDLKETVSAIRDDLDDLHEETDQLDTITDRLGSLDDRVSEVRTDLDEMSEFRNRLISAVGNPQENADE